MKLSIALYWNYWMLEFKNEGSQIQTFNDLLVNTLNHISCAISKSRKVFLLWSYQTIRVFFESKYLNEALFLMMKSVGVQMNSLMLKGRTDLKEAKPWARKVETTMSYPGWGQGWWCLWRWWWWLWWFVTNCLFRVSLAKTNLKGVRGVLLGGWWCQWWQQW